MKRRWNNFLVCLSYWHEIWDEKLHVFVKCFLSVQSSLFQSSCDDMVFLTSCLQFSVSALSLAKKAKADRLVVLCKSVVTGHGRMKARPRLATKRTALKKKKTMARTSLHEIHLRWGGLKFKQRNSFNKFWEILLCHLFMPHYTNIVAK